MDRSILPFLKPQGIVVVGASSSEEKLGHGVARNLAQSGFRGAIHFVSQMPGELFGRPVFGSLADVPDPVDLAVLAIPARATPAAIRECGARGIQAVIIESAGFREAGGEGARLEQECLETARACGVRLLGPNCIGVVDTHAPFDTTFLQPPMPPMGGIGFVSQSGAFCAAIVDWSRQQGFGFSQIVSLGNQTDIDETEMLTAVSADENTRVVALYLEGLSEGTRFVEAAREVTRQKPVVAIKVGRTDSGRKAVASHTAALAGSDAAFDAAFTRCGVLRAATAEELFDWARALECCHLPEGRRVAVLTNAGGPGVIAADALEANALQLAQLSEDTLRELSARLPDAASVHNPVDMLASASPRDYAACLGALLRDQGVDAALVILPPPPMHAAEEVARAMIPIVRGSRKPVAVALLGSNLVAAAAAVLADSNIPTYPFPERAVSALASLHRRAAYLRTADAGAMTRPFGVGAIPSGDNAALVSAYGIPLLPLTLATTREDAVAIATGLGFPVVLKIASPDILHKSDVGGVLTDLADEAAVRSGYAQLIESARAAVPHALVEGIHVQPQISGGQETIIGSVRDPQFGAIMMFGAGGVEAEAMRDVAFDLAPLNDAMAEALMRRTHAGRRLDGYRGIPAVDAAAARDALVRLSWLAVEHPEITQIEINPLRVMASGAHALDVRVSR